MKFPCLSSNFCSIFCSFEDFLVHLVADACSLLKFYCGVSLVYVCVFDVVYTIDVIFGHERYCHQKDTGLYLLLCSKLSDEKEGAYGALSALHCIEASWKI